MDKIIIQDLQIYAYHGVHPEEKELGQMFLISAELLTNLGSAAKTDRLSDTVHYGHVCRDIEYVMQSAKFDLIETAAYRIIKAVFENYPVVSSVKVTVKKPWAPMGRHLKYVAVELQRTRGELYGPEK